VVEETPAAAVVVVVDLAGLAAADLMVVAPAATGKAACKNLELRTRN